jgi:GrpB-like predicted nucleotidyltransferase (UPF0157 family)
MPEPVIIVDYDPQWPVIFNKLKINVLTVLGNLPVTIEHVGSTSVPGLAAKPVIDMDIVVKSSEDIPETIQRLATLGYVHEGDLGITGREAFSAPEGYPGHHLYLCTQDSRKLHRHLVFRDYLRQHPEVAAEYGKLKKGLAQKYRDDREGYTEAKTEFIENILGYMKKGND